MKFHWNEPIGIPSYDFTTLSEKYNLSLDFHDTKSVALLTESILLEYHGIAIKVPDNHLCPRVPNRLCYVKWVLQILGVASSKIAENVQDATVIDIGTGASLIHCLLLAATNSSVRCVGTEVDPESVEFATENLLKNEPLKSRIEILQSDKDTESALVPSEAIPPHGVVATMCNPPFYSAQELQNAEFLERVQNTGLAATESELFYKDGEVGFIGRMIADSVKIGKKVRWYTSMVGKYSSLDKIVAKFRDCGITNYGIIELNPNDAFFNEKRQLKQNNDRNMVRWAVMWSWDKYHVPDYLGRCFLMSMRHLNSYTTTIRLPMERSDELCTKLRHELSRLPHCEFGERVALSGLNGDTPMFSVQVPGAVWSRKYRRSMKLGHKLDHGLRSEFYLILEEKQLIVFWNYGASHQDFESFGGWVKSTLRSKGQ